MPRKNAVDVSAKERKPVNQQERPEVVGWIVGFTDGEGCFSVSILKNISTRLGWQVFPEFVITQGSKSRASLELCKQFFGCGNIFENRRNDNHRESLLRYCVRSVSDLRERIIPFFKKYQLRTEKKRDFEKFYQILELMETKHHLHRDGVTKIATIISQMNRKSKPRFLESSETTCRTLETEKI